MSMENNSPSKGCRVYVGNLPWKVTWPILKNHMKKAGDVVRVDIFEDTQGRSKGCGIVEYATYEEAQEAISSLNDSKLEGRNTEGMITVRDFRRDEFRRGGGEFRRDYRRDEFRRGGGEFRRSSKRNCTLIVYNLPPQVTWKELKDLFRKHGRVVRADLKNEDNSSKELIGVVIMENEYEAKNAIDALNFCNFDGYILKVNYENNE
ncbi:hypothetical protein PFHG_01576 [Plasmodium falciparum HB3]|uniref:RRM domain-containing protein n=1 Tax=Plasmodium falciparum (isolate HB3) TaxID=137071 RepID=A0A0L7K8R3_PLAFX|nr:hypothetical protein PFHG_01576 [Plasmodium falciparum HB3]